MGSTWFYLKFCSLERRFRLLAVKRIVEALLLVGQALAGLQPTRVRHTTDSCNKQILNDLDRFPDKRYDEQELTAELLPTQEEWLEVSMSLATTRLPKRPSISRQDSIQRK